MPSPTSTRTRRRQTIQDLIREYEIPSQGALQELLAQRGVQVNQATLSRDLRDLGVVKGPTGYSLLEEIALPAGGAVPAPLNGDLEHAVRTFLLRATPALNQVVLHTPPSAAAPLALALDQSGHPDVLGTLAGDDTVLVICPDARRAVAFASHLVSFLGSVSR